MALDETVVKANKKAYYVYSAVDVEKNELILMRVYTNRNYPATRSFREVLRVLREEDQNSSSIKPPSLIDGLKKAGSGI